MSPVGRIGPTSRCGKCCSWTVDRLPGARNPGSRNRSDDRRKFPRDNFKSDCQVSACSIVYNVGGSVFASRKGVYMKKSIKLIAAVLMAAVLVFTLCVGLSAATGSFSSGPVSGGCSYSPQNGSFSWNAGMSCPRDHTFYDLYLAGVYIGSADSDASSSIGDSGSISSTPPNSADWAYSSAAYGDADYGYFYIT